MPGLTAKTQRGGQIGGTQEDAVDAVDACNGVELFDRRDGFHLDQHADLRVRLLQVVAVTVPARCPGERAPDAADTVRWVTRRAHRRPRLLGGFDERHEQGLCADVEQLLEVRGIIMRRADDAMHRIGGHGLKLREQSPDRVRSVLRIEGEPVEAGAGADLGAVGVGEAEPQTDLRLPRGERLLESIGGCAHVRNLQAKRSEIVPSGPKSARNSSPARAGIGRMNEPARTTCPVSSVRS